MHLAPLRIDFSEPTILNATHAQEKYAKHLSVVTAKGNDTQWIWLVITAPGDVPPDGARSFIPAAHPMHLHGHDFALLKQSENRWTDDRERFELNCENPSAINCTNPPRRDVVLLPANGYVIIAFKADNPGSTSYLLLWSCYKYVKLI
jgi:Multicopper oxidase